MLFYEHQPCFQLLLLVSSALVVSTNGLYQKIDKGNYTSLILIGLKKGFKKVDLEPHSKICRMNGTPSYPKELFYDNGAFFVLTMNHAMPRKDLH